MKLGYLIYFISIGFSITTKDIYDNSWALVIGIDKYQNVQKLNYAVDDAESIKEILEDSFHFPSDNISILINEEATKQNILKSFSEITKNAKGNDRVLVFFAGHGETMDLPGGGEMGYLLPVDGDREDLYLSSIGMDELKKLSLMSKAKHVLYLIDACYSGIAAIGSRSLEPEKTPDFINKVTKFQSRQVITAGGRGEKVIEKPEWGHSAFTLNLIRGLKDGAADYNGDGFITATELGMFLSDKVSTDSENQQTPQYGRMTSQGGEFVFIYSENTIVNQQNGSSNNDEKMDLILDKLNKLEKQASDKTTIDEEDDENAWDYEDYEDVWDDEDLLFHVLFYSSYNNNTSMPETNRLTMGLAKAIDPNLDLQVGIMFDTYDEFENDSLEYSSTGLRVGINKKIYKNIISSQIALSILRSTYKNDVTDTFLDNNIGFTIEISMGVIFPYLDAMFIQFLTGYNFNGIKNQDDEDLLNSPFVGIGMQILGDWF